MSKTLSNILTVFKVAKIVAKVIFIICIVGGVGCLVGLAMLPMASALLSASIFAEEGVDISSAYLGCIVGVITCAGEAVFAFLVERYCGHVLNAGTPFTFDGAKESFRLGIASIIISLATSIVAGIISIGFLLFSGPEAAQTDISMFVSLSTGLFFLFMSIIFKHGAEIKSAHAEETQREEQKSETEAL